MTTKTKTVEEKAPRETIETIRHENNNLLIKQDKTWPNMYTITREQGGQTPVGVKGMYTSHAKADAALQRYLG